MNSQFKVISNIDAGAPILTGFSGSLINVLNFALVSGSGWLQPSASVKYSGSVDTLAVYQQPSGSRCVLFINDAAPHGTALGKEAWATGWEYVTEMTSSNTTASIGVGYGQFPSTGILTVTSNNGHITIVKSNTADNTIERPWFMFVDDYTFYLFIDNGVSNTGYESFFFGDIFSLQGPGDVEKCMIQGRLSDNIPTTAGNNQNDSITTFVHTITTMGQGSSGFINRTSDGRFLSNWICKQGDIGKALSVVVNTTDTYPPMAGFVGCPNGTDKSIYLSPVSVVEVFGGTTNPCLRGRMRGMYHVCHPIAVFADGFIFNGTGENYGKMFQIIKKGPNNGMWCIEISNTVETN